MGDPLHAFLQELRTSILIPAISILKLPVMDMSIFKLRNQIYLLWEVWAGPCIPWTYVYVMHEPLKLSIDSRASLEYMCI